MILEIKKFPDLILREKCSPVVIGDDSIPNLINNMVKTMKENEGIGLAAPQVGFSLQLVIIDVRQVQTPFSWVRIDGKPVDAKRFQPLILINPEIKESGMISKINEGCLSIPNQFNMVARKSIVTVEALDKNFKPISFECGGMIARCIQHEVDHLKGILFTDYLLTNEKQFVSI